MEQLKRIASKKVPKVYGAIVAGMLTVLLITFSVRENLKETAVSAALLVVIVALLQKLKFDQNVGLIKRAPLILFLITFIVRYSYCCVFGPIVQQSSDFSVTLWEAQCGSFVDMVEYYRYYLHKFLYPFLLHMFGFRTQDRILFLQCIFVSFIPVILYFIGKKIKNESVGLLAAGVYIVWPAQIFYTTVVSEEHLAALVTVSTAYFLIDLADKIEKKDYFLQHKKRVLVELFGVGLLCGLSSFLKDWAVIMLIAVVVCAAYLFIVYDNWQRIILILGIGIIFLSRSICQTTITTVAERKLGVEANNGVVAAQMYVSLDPNGDGLWNAERVGEYQKIVKESDYDFSAANRQALKEVVQKVKDNLDKMPSFLLNKGTNAYSNDEDMLRWALDNQMNTDYHPYFISNIYIWKGISTLFYAFCVLCLCVSAITLRDKYIFFIELVLVGAMLSGLLIECQGRYKYSIEPIWCILVANAIYILLQWRKLRMKVEQFGESRPSDERHDGFTDSRLNEE